MSEQNEFLNTPPEGETPEERMDRLTSDNNVTDPDVPTWTMRAATCIGVMAIHDYPHEHVKATIEALFMAMPNQLSLLAALNTLSTASTAAKTNKNIADGLQEIEDYLSDN